MKTNFCRFLIGLVAFVVGIPVMAQTGPDKVKPFSHLSVSLNAGTLGGGLQVAAPLNDYLGLRAGFSLLKFKCNYDYDGIRDDQLIQDVGTRTGYNPDKYYTVPLKAKANMTNGMLLLDYFQEIRLSCDRRTAVRYFIHPESIGTDRRTDRGGRYHYRAGSGRTCGSSFEDQCRETLCRSWIRTFGSSFTRRVQVRIGSYVPW